MFHHEGRRHTDSDGMSVRDRLRLEAAEVELDEYHRRRQMSGRYLFGLSAAAAISLIVLSVMIVVEMNYREAQQEEVCQRQVNTRDDHRFMWIAFLDQFPDEPTTPTLREQLDTRLPALFCEGSELRQITDGERAGFTPDHLNGDG